MKINYYTFKLIIATTFITRSISDTSIYLSNEYHYVLVKGMLHIENSLYLSIYLSFTYVHKELAITTVVAKRNFRRQKITIFHFGNFGFVKKGSNSTERAAEGARVNGHPLFF